MIYRFDDFVIDTRARTVFRHNARCFLEPLAFDVLVHLCEDAQSIIPTEALYERHWPNVVVTPNSLTRVIAQIRKTLEDDHRAPRFIETVPKAGYRFIAEVTTEESARALPSHKKTPYYLVVASLFICFISLLVFLFPTNKSQQPVALVVFPFESTDNISFAHSFSQELIEEFYVVPEIQLRSFLAAEQALATSEDLHRAAVSLGATHYINGRVEKSETSTDLMFYTELVKTETDQVVWSERITKPFASQAAWSAQTKASILQTLLGLPGKQASAAKAREPHPEAYRLYLKAKYIWLQRGKQPMSDAVYLLKEAVTIDPEFAAAWDSLAAVLVSWQTYDAVPESVLEDAALAARHAIVLDEGVSYSYFLLYQEALEAQQYREALEFVKKMRDNAPANAMAVYWYATSLRELGHMNDAHEALRRAIALDPTIWVTQADFAITTMHTADIEAAYQKLTDLWGEGGRALWLWRGIFQAKLLLNEKGALRDWLQEVELNEAQQALIDLELHYFETREIDHDAVKAFLKRDDLAEVDHRTIIFSLHYLQQADLLFDYVATRISNNQFVAVYALAVLSTDYVNDPRMKALFNQMGLLAYWKDNAITDICRYTDGQWQCSQFHRELNQQDFALLSH